MGNTASACCQAPQTEHKTQVIIPTKQDNHNVQPNKLKSHPQQQLNVIIKQPELSAEIKQNLQKYHPFADKIDGKLTLKKYGDQIYQGNIDKQGRPHGYGKMYYTNGSIFIGEFKQGVAQGPGHFVWKNGSFYQGNMSKNKANDQHAIYQCHDFIYKGGIKENVFEGKGVQSGKGFTVQGTYKNGILKQGKLTWSQQQKQRLPITNMDIVKDVEYIYEGNFDDNGLFTGKGVLISSKGKYTGNFQKGLKNGEGVFEYENKLRYQGTYKNDVKQGKGTIFSAQNKKIAYQGQFKNGLPHGKGWVPFPDGTPNNLQFTEGISSVIMNQQQAKNYMKKLSQSKLKQKGSEIKSPTK